MTTAERASLKNPLGGLQPAGTKPIGQVKHPKTGTMVDIIRRVTRDGVPVYVLGDGSTVPVLDVSKANAKRAEPSESVTHKSTDTRLGELEAKVGEIDGVDGLGELDALSARVDALEEKMVAMANVLGDLEAKVAAMSSKAVEGD